MSFAHLHLLVNHFPVVGAVLGVLLIAVAMLRHSPELERAALWLFTLLGAGGILVFLTGEPAEDSVENLAGFSDALAGRHEAVALAATVAMGVLGALCAAALIGYRRTPLPRWVMTVVLVAAIGSASIMGYTANLGGQIRHTEIRGGDVAGTAAPAPAGAAHDSD